MRAFISNGLRRVALVSIAIASAGLLPEAASAQQPLSTDTPISSLRNVLGPGAYRNTFRRLQYHYEPRAYPNERIPPGAMQSARQYYTSTWGSSPTLPPAFAQDTWTPIGPDTISTGLTTSGRLTTIAVHLNTGGGYTIYVGGAQGGVWRSINDGASWTPLTDTQCSLAMGSIAVDPTNPSIIYAGTGEQHFSADSYYGCGVLRSADAGASWTQLGAAQFDTANGGAKIAKVAIDPTTPTTILVASDFGVYRSTNSGTTFTLSLSGSASDLVIDPSNPSIVYAAIGNAFGAAANGVYKSTDGGATFPTKLTTGFPAAGVGRVNLTISTSNSQTLYAAIQDSTNFGNLLAIVKTINGGTSWTTQAAAGATCGSQCWYDMVIAVDPTNENIVYFGAVLLYRSTDGAASFTNILNGIHVDQHALAFMPGTPTTIFSGNDGGIFKSTNSGSSWTSLNTNIAITQFYDGVSVHPTDANIALGGTQDNHTLLYTGSTTWAPVSFSGVGGCDGGYTGIDFTTPATRYAECQWGGGVAPSGYSGPRRSDGGAYVLKTAGIDPADRALFIPPIKVSPSNSQTVYFGTYRLYRSTDRGDNWTAISPDLTDGACTGNVVTGTCAISAIAQAPSSANVIYVGTRDANVQVTTNGGTNWNNLVSGLPARAVTDLAVHPTDTNTAFVTFSGFGAGHVFKTVNGGTSWTNISGNLPDLPVNAIVIDPAAPTNEIIVGTDLGVFRTTNGGTTWSPFTAGMPNVAIFDLVHNQTTGVLLAATHGRGIFKGVLSSGPALAVTPGTNFSSSGDVGGPFSPSSAPYTVQNSGSGTLNWTASSSNTTVATVSPPSGSLGAGASATVTASIAAAATGLAAGSYSSTLTFTNTNNGSGNTTRAANLTVNSPGGTPANDNFANAINLPGQSGSTTGTNVAATLQAGEPAPFAGTGTHTVWWKWTAPVSGPVTFDTTGSNFDTVLTAYTGSAVNALTLIAGNDDIDNPNSNLQSRITFAAQSGLTYYVRVDGFAPADAGSIALGWSEPQAASTLVAAVLPYARSVQIGQQASAFGVVINAGGTTATSCSVALPAGLAGAFVYQTTNPSNQLTGSPNTPVSIGAGAAQNFVFGYTPSAVLDSLEIGVVFDCANTPPVVSIPGVNTLILSASSTPTPDIVAIGVTPSGDGIVNIPGNTATGFFAAAGINIGATATITASADDGGRGLPLTLSICQTNPGTGACLSPPAASTTTTFDSNATLTYTVFAQGAGNIPYDPANSRLFLRFKDAGGVTRGATNVAVRTQAAP